MTHLVTLYSAAKSGLGAVFGASEDLLHLHAGLLIFFAAALLFKRRMRSRVPIALVWVFALANELIDRLAPERGAAAWEPVADVANTVFWPTLLFLLARRPGKAGHPSQTA
jgi:lipoprotein signal peptidase